MPKSALLRYAEISGRIPREYFWVVGWGESHVGIETGSYDAALHMAGIENYNLMLYSSMLPPEAVELRQLPKSASASSVTLCRYQILKWT